jgi:GTP cyclohydrolase IB
MTLQKQKLEDVQNKKDIRNIPINQVGIKDIQHPIVFVDRDDKECASVANITMSVYLDESKKGTHMSRFVELLNENHTYISIASLKGYLAKMLTRLDSDKGQIKLEFKYFVKKTAPVSGIESFLDYDVTLTGEKTQNSFILSLSIKVPVTSLCPCSKEISKYGAHNQRSVVTLSLCVEDNVFIEDLIDMIETQASCDLYGVLKRSDEKYVTEKAYERPKFVEDITRDIAIELNKINNISSYVLEVENYESIHNHSAYARIKKS